MTLQAGVATSLRYKAETVLNTPLGPTGGQKLRRVKSSLSGGKDTFQSNEVRTDQEIVDLRHGTGRIKGNIDGELSLNTYDDFIEAALRGTWTTGVTSGALTTVAAAIGTPGTFTRTGGSWITDGFRVGDVVRWTGWATTGVPNNAKNYRITALSATVMTVAESVATKAAGDSVTVTVPGKKLITGVAKRSFAIEHYFADIGASQLFTGVRIGSMALSLPPTGLATTSFGTMGVDFQNLSGGASPYYTGPTAETTTGIFAAVNGTLAVNGTAIAIVTGLNVNVDLGLSADPVVGSNFVPEIFYGSTKVTGQMTMFLQDITVLDYFKNESEISLTTVLNTATGSPLDFMSIKMPRIKLLGADIDNSGQQGTPITVPFQALGQSGGNGIDAGSLIMQRSL